MGDLIKDKKVAELSNSVVYNVPCGGCLKTYVGETYKDLKIRISEHRTHVRTTSQQVPLLFILKRTSIYQHGARQKFCGVDEESREEN